MRKWWFYWNICVRLVQFNIIYKIQTSKMTEIVIQVPVAKGLSHSVNEADLEQVEKSFEVLNSLLEGRQFAAGDDLSIADFTISTSICSVLVSTGRGDWRKIWIAIANTISRLQCFDFDISSYDNVAAYYDRCKESLEKFGFEEVHAIGVKAFTEMYHASLQESS